MDNQEKQVGRIGVDISASEHRVVGYWDSGWGETNNLTTPIGRLRQEFGNALGIAKTYHDRVQERKVAQLTNRKFEELEPKVREARARDDLKKLAELSNRVRYLEDQALIRRTKLQPFEYKDSHISDVMLRREMRETLRAAKPHKRAELLRDPVFQRAALEGPAALSGEGDQVMKALRERVIAEKYPDDVKETDAVFEAVDLVNRAIAAGEAAATKEIYASGAVLVQKPEKKSAAWA